MNIHALSRIGTHDPSSQASSDYALNSMATGVGNIIYVVFYVNIIDSNVIHWCDVQGREITIKATDSEYPSAAAACIIFD